MEKNQLAEAEQSLREAIRYDSQLPQAYYQLGRVLESANRDPEAVEALKQWKFKPGLKNGKPVAVSLNIEVNFRLQ